ncbi:MAG: hypothetical protein WCK52_04795 [Betaproteobacteria bacterium]
MRYLCAMCLMLMFRNSSAVYFADDPKAFFSAKKIFTTTSTITWKQVKNINKECTKESKRRGMNGFPIKLKPVHFGMVKLA